MSGSSPQLTLKKGAPGDQVLDLLCVQLASYLERGPLMWMMPLHLHVNQKSDYDDDDGALRVKLFLCTRGGKIAKVLTCPKEQIMLKLLSLALNMLNKHTCMNCFENSINPDINCLENSIDQDQLAFSEAS